SPPTTVRRWQKTASMPSFSSSSPCSLHKHHIAVLNRSIPLDDDLVVPVDCSVGQGGMGVVGLCACKAHLPGDGLLSAPRAGPYLQFIEPLASDDRGVGHEELAVFRAHLEAQR